MEHYAKQDQAGIGRTLGSLALAGSMLFVAAQIVGCGQSVPKMEIDPSVEKILSFEDCTVRVHVECVLHNKSSFNIPLWSIHADFYDADGVKIADRDFPPTNIEPGQKLRAPISKGSVSDMARIEIRIR